MSVRYCGRDFSAAEVRWIRACAAKAKSRHAHAKAVCEHLGWRKPDGEIKLVSAKVAMVRMHADGLIELPAKQVVANFLKPPPELDKLPQTDAPVNRAALPQRLEQVRPLRFEIITAGPQSPLWNSYIERYHYLGHARLPGAQMRYLVRSCDEQPLALLGFGASAWSTAPRDAFIGWDADTRKRNLARVVNNARFLILPWIRIDNLASHILSKCARRIAQDWDQRYAIRPVLLETFCEQPRFFGTCYQAANWVKVGQTKGRGKKDRFSEYALPIKDIWLRPLQKDWRKVLNA